MIKLFKLVYPKKLWFFDIVNQTEERISYKSNSVFVRKYKKMIQIDMKYSSELGLYIVNQHQMLPSFNVRVLKICNKETEARICLIDHIKRIEKRYKFKESLK